MWTSSALTPQSRIVYQDSPGVPFIHSVYIAWYAYTKINSLYKDGKILHSGLQNIRVIK